MSKSTYCVLNLLLSCRKLQCSNLISFSSLQLFSASFINHLRDIERLLLEYPYKHLAEHEINGFYGSQHEVEFLTYLLENAISLALRRILVGTSQQIPKINLTTGFIKKQIHSANQGSRQSLLGS